MKKNKGFRECACGKIIPWGRTTLKQYMAKKKCGSSCPAQVKPNNWGIKLNQLGLNRSDDVQVGIVSATGEYERRLK